MNSPHCMKWSVVHVPEDFADIDDFDIFFFLNISIDVHIDCIKLLSQHACELIKMMAIWTTCSPLKLQIMICNLFHRRSCQGWTWEVGQCWRYLRRFRLNPSQDLPGHQEYFFCTSRCKWELFCKTTNSPRTFFCGSGTAKPAWEESSNHTKQCELRTQALLKKRLNIYSL